MSKQTERPARRGGERVGPLASRRPGEPPLLDVDALLDDAGTQVVVCCGSGGVGKTTTAAALALRAAERGRRVVVLTIDPARRLAQSMGIEKLDNTPRPVPGVDPAAGGSLDAMMLDMKRTFDEVVESQASPGKAQAILTNPFYVALSSSFAGTQEYMAMEKLGQLRKDAGTSDSSDRSDSSGRSDSSDRSDSSSTAGRWDLIVVDTPPARSALDFLDAPERLSGFLDGRFIRLLLAPAKGPARLMTAGVGAVTNTMAKVVGAQVLRDLQMFVAAFDTLFGGFRNRAQQTFEMLQTAETAFLVVAAPESDALREAAYFVERLDAEHMPLAGLVVNRATDGIEGLSVEQAVTAADRLEAAAAGADGSATAALTAGVLRLHADRMTRLAREIRLRQRFQAAHPHVATVVVPALSTDVHDLEGLRRIGELLVRR